jgi:hypothetical protein
MRASARVGTFLFAACALFLSSVASHAGTLCGTVRDGSTAGFVAGAGIFVFTTDGAFTGFEGVSDENGAFCIEAIPAGTYDLQVRRDHYRTTHVRGVEVTDIVSVDIPVPPIGAILLSPRPNPARAHVQFRFRLDGPGRVRLEVFDARGRRIKGWESQAALAGERSLDWDLRIADGRRAPAGRYIVRLSFPVDSRRAVVTRAFTIVP